MRLKATIEYAGTRYSGWQIQKNARTVQGELERAIRDAAGIPPAELYGAGRTDAGVHALGQVAHLDLETTLAPELLRRRINEALPADIVVVGLEKTRRTFHARHDAMARSYLYQISRRKAAFAKPFVWWVKEPLDVDAMRQAARAFVGFHDFRSFTDDDPGEKSTAVALDTLDVHEDDDLLVIHTEGSHFIWKMVRRLVGVLAAAGRGDLPVGDMPSLLTHASEVPARLTAPAAGLFLERVYYEGDRRDAPVRAPVRILRRG
jgi:tRNA pseudouridine38-40 synthase